MIRKHLIYQGRVQGVGFRYTTLRTAANFVVSGYVRNLPDGRVEVVVEGSELTVDSFLGELHKILERNIYEINENCEPATNEFSGFSIRY